MYMRRRNVRSSGSTHSKRRDVARAHTLLEGMPAGAKSAPVLLTLLHGELLSEEILDRLLVSQEQLLVALVRQFWAVPWLRQHAAIFAAGLSSTAAFDALPADACDGCDFALKQAAHRAALPVIAAATVGDVDALRVALVRVPRDKAATPNTEVM